MALKLNPLASQPYKLASSARLPISTFRSPKFLCLALSSSTKSVSFSLYPLVSFAKYLLLPIVFLGLVCLFGYGSMFCR
ncbi:hypothetical protein IGI04_041051 [Brassica rapa subsp. trilocularis]|uniref:Uncharacterized protein n=1 Tax=Brassica rapa subsp. trilocularis TaxID=1813537 RepID=A0ABQ7KPN0_BRACM|nr:hypothetical protein IGI04_041051 [Brassica rapa subsp. trilocularis]